MAFSDAIKTKIRRRSHFSCCLCHSLGVEIHHIIPEADGGQDSEENGAPLCPSCHETYGANPEKRKFIREARDFWYEVCAKRFISDTDQLSALSETLKTVATKEDLKRLAVQNNSYILGRSEGNTQPWEQLRYSFVRPEFIHPLIVRELLGWLSDRRETIVSVDLVSANQSNRFFGDSSLREQNHRVAVEWINEARESFSYSQIAISPSGVHMVQCWDCGGGSGVFTSIVLLALECDRAFDHDASGAGLTRERVLLKTLGSISLGDRYAGEVKYEDGLLVIGPDQGWFNRGVDACQKIPIL
jgi:HNH endonuclease